MSGTLRSGVVARLAVLVVLAFAVSVPPALAQGGGTPDPSGVATLQALRVEVNALDQRFLALTTTLEPSDVYLLKRLADLLARIDARLAVATVGGGTPDPGATSALNRALLDLRSETLELRDHIASVLAIVAGNPIFDLITETKTLQFMRATATMVVARLNYALPLALAPPSPPSDL